MVLTCRILAYAVKPGFYIGGKINGLTSRLSAGLRNDDEGCSAFALWFA
jgi:hypothetical protein